MPSSLDQLSTELLINVLSYIHGPHNLANFCDSFPQCRQLAGPFFRNYLESYYCTGLASLKNFVGFMLNYPYLRQYVVQLDFDQGGYPRDGVEDWGMKDERDTKDHTLEMLAVMRMAAFPERYGCQDDNPAYEVVRMLNDTSGVENGYPGWTDDDTRRDVLIVMLLILLPNVRHKHIESWADEYFMTHLFHEAMEFLEKADEDHKSSHRHAEAREAPLQFSLNHTLIPSQCLALLHLAQLSIRCTAQPHEECTSSIAQITPYFCLPSLIRLDGYDMITSDSDDEDEDNDAENDKVLSRDISVDRRYGISRTPQRMSSVTSLNFVCCIISITQLEMAIQIPKVLESFHYSYEDLERLFIGDDARPVSDEEEFSGPRLNEILLRHAKTTLVSLSLDANPWHFDDSPSMGSLREYKVLKHLSVALVLLLGRADEERADRLTEMLPPTLESLCIYSCLEDDDERVWQPHEYVPHFLELLMQKAAIVPNLKQLKIGAFFPKELDRPGDPNVHLEIPQNKICGWHPAHTKLQDACNAADVELIFLKTDVSSMNVQEIARVHVA